MAGYKVSFSGLPHDDSHYAVVLKAGITKADEGKAINWDGTNPNQAKLAADGEVVEGYLVTVESRVQEGVLVGTVAIRGGVTMTTDGSTVNVGDSIQGGATAGLIKSLPATLENAAGAVAIKGGSHTMRNRVMEKPTSNTAVVLFY